MRRVLCIIWSLGWTLHEGNDEHLPILVTHTHRYLPQLPYQNNIQHANTHSRYHPYPSRHTFTAIIYGNGQHQPIDTLHNYHIRTTCGLTLTLQARGGLESESCIKLLMRERIGGSLVWLNHVQVSFWLPTFLSCQVQPPFLDVGYIRSVEGVWHDGKTIHGITHAHLWKKDDFSVKDD